MSKYGRNAAGPGATKGYSLYHCNTSGRPGFPGGYQAAFAVSYGSASSGSQGDGVYVYRSTSQFPTNTYNATDYCVDTVLSIPGWTIAARGTR